MLYINRCVDTYGLCSGHICLNLKGHFKCQCFDGYQVRGHRFCKSKSKEKPLLMFANRHDIRILDILPVYPNVSGSDEHIHHNHHNHHIHYTSLYSQLSSTISIDYSLKDNYIIWSDVSNENLFIAPLNSSEKTYNGLTEPKQLVQNGGVVDALAVDWIHRLVYWTDTTKDLIQVANISSPQSTTIIINSNLEEPRGIAVNVIESWIVWTDWGSQPKIEKSLQDGTQRHVLIDKHIILAKRCNH